ncbi:MAG: family 10 glycosylhydrolase [Armatimonadota bacterium]|nr:family 10 glycosylhydrolase [Armatimonadota bacterium]
MKYADKLNIVCRRRNIARWEGSISNTVTPSVIPPSRFTSLLWVFVLVLALCVGASARPEFRGAWVTGWTHGFLTPEEADATVAAAKAANINALFIQVRKVGDAYYDSAYEPRATNIGVQEYDPLAYVIERAHREGIEVHAWVNALRVQLGSRSNSDPRHVCNRRPEWLTRDVNGRVKSSDGLYLDPGAPGVQDYTAQIVLDILRKYNVDGIHLDYLRYPGGEWGYNSAAVARFNSRYGRSGSPSADDPRWSAWRREQVTSLARRIYREVNAARPEVKLTAAAICWGEPYDSFERTDAYRQAFQDWPKWMREGIVDAVVPMNYRGDRSPASARQYRRWLDNMCGWRYDRHIYAGQMVGEDLAGAIAQLRASRASGSEGIVCFMLNDTPQRGQLVLALRRSAYTQPADIPIMPWKERFARVPGRGKSSEF